MFDVIRTDTESVGVASCTRLLKTGSSPCGLEFNSRRFIVRFLVDEMPLGFFFLVINPPFIQSHLEPFPEVRDSLTKHGICHILYLYIHCWLFNELGHSTKHEYTLENGGGGDSSYLVTQHIARLKYFTTTQFQVTFLPFLTSMMFKTLPLSPPNEKFRRVRKIAKSDY